MVVLPVVLPVSISYDLGPLHVCCSVHLRVSVGIMGAIPSHPDASPPPCSLWVVVLGILFQRAVHFPRQAACDTANGMQGRQTVGVRARTTDSGCARNTCY